MGVLGLVYTSGDNFAHAVNPPKVVAIVIAGSERTYGLGDEIVIRKVDALLRITDLRITSEPEDAPTYHYGEHIELTARTNAAVDVEPGGTFLSIHVGEGDGSEVWRAAHYNRGSGTDTLVFRYTVKALDVDTDGVMALWGNANYGLGGSGKIKAGNVELSRLYDGFNDQSGHKVDGSQVGGL